MRTKTNGEAKTEKVELQAAVQNDYMLKPGDIVIVDRAANKIASNRGEAWQSVGVNCNYTGDFGVDKHAYDPRQEKLLRESGRP